MEFARLIQELADTKAALAAAKAEPKARAEANSAGGDVSSANAGDPDGDEVMDGDAAAVQARADAKTALAELLAVRAIPTGSRAALASVGGYDALLQQKQSAADAALAAVRALRPPADQLASAKAHHAKMEGLVAAAVAAEAGAQTALRDTAERVRTEAEAMAERHRLEKEAAQNALDAAQAALAKERSRLVQAAAEVQAKAGLYAPPRPAAAATASAGPATSVAVVHAEQVLQRELARVHEHYRLREEALLAAATAGVESAADPAGARGIDAAPAEGSAGRGREDGGGRRARSRTRERAEQAEALRKAAAAVEPLALVAPGGAFANLGQAAPPPATATAPAVAAPPAGAAAEDASL